MTFALSKHGLGKLCGKSVTIKSTSGAVPATAAHPTDIKDVQEIVLHVGTNCVNNNTTFESPTGIADEIVKKAMDLQSKATTAKIYISSIVSRSDLVDDKNDTTAANEKIKQTNELVKEQCNTNNITFIDNANIGTEDLYDGLHLNTSGAKKLAKNIATEIRRRNSPNNTASDVNDRTPPAQRAFKTVKAQTFGEKASIRRKPIDRRPYAGTATANDNDNNNNNNNNNNARRRARHEDSYQSAWPALPTGPNWRQERQRLEQPTRNRPTPAQHNQAEFINTLVNNLLNNYPYPHY